MNRTTGDSHNSPKNKKKTAAGRDRNGDRRALIKASLPVTRDHILIRPLFSRLSEREAEERPFDSAARANLHEK